MEPGGIGRLRAARAFALVLLLALGFAGSADAQQQRPGRGGAQKPAPQQPMMPPSERPRDAAWRERQQQHPHGRMNDEERRQLRRDISDHGRDIYQDRQGQRR